MPRNTAGGQVGAGAITESTLAPTLAGWQVTGLSLAVLVGHVLNGAGAFVFGLLSVGVIWTLHRLRGNAPHARTTADLISSVPGAVPARAVRVVQFSAYALIGAYSTTNIVSLALTWSTDPDATPPDWSVPALCILVVGLAATAVATLPTRLLALVATALAAIGLLAYFYVALAVIAKIASGAQLAAPSMDIEASSALTEWGAAATVIALAIVFAGFEIPTTANDRLTSVRRPLGLAIALIAICATTAWVASNMATAGGFRYEATDLVFIASDMFGQSTTLALFLATIALTVAAVLVLMWGATRVIRPAAGSTPVPLVTTAVVTGVLACTLAIGFGDMQVDLWAVAGLLLLVLYVAAAHANSRLDDSSTTAWAWLVLMAIVLAIATVLTGASRGWWPVVVAIVIVAAASAWAIQTGKTPPATKARPQSKSERLSRGNRTS